LTHRISSDAVTTDKRNLSLTVHAIPPQFHGGFVAFSKWLLSGHVRMNIIKHSLAVL
jgi:hypothetical protein